MKYPFPVPNGLLDYHTCKYCAGKGCATCNGNGWHTIVEPDPGNDNRGKHKTSANTSRLQSREIEEMAMLYRDGMQKKEIADRFGLSQNRVSELISKYEREHGCDGIDFHG